MGYYRGISYGFGYFGTGYNGGRWQNDHFYYNTAVSRIDAKKVHNIYADKTTRQNYKNANHASFNGNGGIVYKPQANERREEDARQFNLPKNKIRISSIQCRIKASFLHHIKNTLLLCQWTE